VGFDDFEVGALCSRNRDNAERYVQRGTGPAPLPPLSQSATDPLSVRDIFVRDLQDHDLKIYTDYEQMLAEGKVDAVVLLSAVSAHHPVALAAMDRGLHVLIEKPFALTCRAATRMVEKSQERGVALGVAENLRYLGGTRAAGWAMRHGLIGNLQMVLSGGVGNIWSPDVIVARTAWRHTKPAVVARWTLAFISLIGCAISAAKSTKLLPWLASSSLRDIHVMTAAASLRRPHVMQTTPSSH